MTEAQIIAGIARIARTIGRIDPSVAIEGDSRLVEDLGIDSLDLVGVYLQIQDDFGVEIEESDVPTLSSVADLASYIAARRPESSSSAAA